MGQRITLLTLAPINTYMCTGQLYRPLVALLHEAGYELNHRKGSHEVYSKPTVPGRPGQVLTIYKNWDENSRHLANKILKKAGVTIHL